MLTALFRKLFPGFASRETAKPNSSRQRATTRLSVEVLEDRRLLSAGSIDWLAQFSSGAGTRIDQAAGVDAAGNVYVAGLVGGTLPGETSAGQQDAFLRKYDPSGTVVWTRQFGATGFDLANGVAVDASGIYVVGQISGTIPGQVGFGSTDAFVRKYDASGNVLWTNQFGTNATDEALGISADASGIYVSGETQGVFPGQASAGGADVFVRKYDATGDVLWTRQFGSSATDLGNGISADASGVYVAGRTHGIFPGQTNAGTVDAFVVKLDTSGTTVWATQFGTIFDDQALGISADASGVYVAGYVEDTLPGQVSAGAADAFVRKYDASGTVTWTRQFGGSGADTAKAVSVYSGSVYVAGITGGTLPGQTSAGSGDAFVCQFDTSGNAGATLQFGTSAFDTASGVSADASGLYVSGWTQGAFSGQTSGGSNDAFVAKLTSAPATISISDVSVTEGGAAVFTVSLSNASYQTVTVDFATADLSALLADSDYTVLNGTVTFLPNVLSQTVTVQTTADSKFELSEQFVVNLSNGSNASIADSQGVGTITKDAGTAGDDTISIDAGTQAGTLKVTINGVVTDNVAVTGVVFIAGLGGNDNITVNAAPTAGLILNGQDGSDKYTVNFGNLAGAVQVLDDGATGTDTLTVKGTPADDVIFKDATSVTLTSPVLESVLFSGIEKRIIRGSLGDDEITDPGADTDLFGDEGNDTIIIDATTGAGVTADGGDGSDTYIVKAAGLGGPVAITDTGTTGTDNLTVQGTVGADTITATSTGLIVNGATITISTGLESLGVNGGGGTDSFTVQGTPPVPVTVQGVAEAVVQGTEGNDTIQFSKSGTSIVATLNGSVVGTFAQSGISRLVAHGGGGNDNMEVESSIALPACLYGGDGDDTLTGGAGNDVLIGGFGADIITGGAGNDVLIGGFGCDRLVGSAGHDILSAGDFGCQLSLNDLQAIGDAWANSRSISSEEEMGDDEVFGDLDQDRLTGSSGADWFIINGGDVITELAKTLARDGDVITYVS